MQLTKRGLTLGGTYLDAPFLTESRFAADAQCSPDQMSMEQIPPSRHGCLTIYLVVLMLVGAVGTVMYLFLPEVIAQSNPEIPPWARPIFAIVGIGQVTCALALWRWRKKGFYVFAAVSIPFAVWNATLTGSALTLAAGPIGVAIMWLALRTGGADRRAWERLR